MKNVAIIMTVFNRKDITIRGIQSLLEAIKNISGYKFDFFLTEDGCTDGTAEAIQEKFSFIKILHGDGRLYWGGGMNLAWKAAIKQGGYDYYMWFNDDADLYGNALELLFDPISLYKDNVIVCGAFKDENDFPSYGGRDERKIILKPNGNFQKIYFMNGNLTLIPASIVDKIGILDLSFQHIGGDWDYGLRAREKGTELLLTREYVGITNRHDRKEFEGNIIRRIKKLYSIKHNPRIVFIFNKRHLGVHYAVVEFIKQHIAIAWPKLFKYKDWLADSSIIKF